MENIQANPSRRWYKLATLALANLIFVVIFKCADSSLVNIARVGNTLRGKKTNKKKIKALYEHFTSPSSSSG